MTFDLDIWHAVQPDPMGQFRRSRSYVKFTGHWVKNARYEARRADRGWKQT